MLKKRWLFPALLAGAFAAVASLGLVQESRAQAARAPDIVGQWTGTWGDYSPPMPEGADAPRQKRKAPPMRLDATVTLKDDGKYEAVFEGDCGRPYKYRIPLPGRSVGASVMFSGSVDLGREDGGVYDWIGRATDKEFIGFYTSQGHVGAFQLSRVKKP